MDFLVLPAWASPFFASWDQACAANRKHSKPVATATGFPDSYQHVVEEVGLANSRQGGTVEPRVRADMVFFETPNGGAVFSVGSISYCGSLSAGNYAGTVSRITGNVLRRFQSPEPFVAADPSSVGLDI